MWRQTCSPPYLLCRLNLFLSKNIKSIFNAPFSAVLPLRLPLLTSKPTAAQHAATVAAVQALITHVQSPLPMGGCVTPVDHFAVLFLCRLWPLTLDYTTRNKKRTREKKKEAYFRFTAIFTSTWALGRNFLLRDLCRPTGCASRRGFVSTRRSHSVAGSCQTGLCRVFSLNERLDSFGRQATSEGHCRRHCRLGRRIFPFSFSGYREAVIKQLLLAS